LDRLAAHRRLRQKKAYLAASGQGREHRKVRLTRDTVLGLAGQHIRVRQSRDILQRMDSRAVQAMGQVQATATHRTLPATAVWIPESLGSAVLQGASKD